MGPLHGVRVIEFAGRGPGPLAAMLIAELGATVLRIERPSDPSAATPDQLKFDLTKRSRSAISIDTKTADGRSLALSLIERADALIEGYRPGVMERLGLGPDDCIRRNPRLVYCRMTGWGQDGPLALRAGHDLNYIALTGALDAIGRAGQPPTPPLNLVGDYAGGAMYLALGLVSAVFEMRQSGKGQVIDVAMVDGVSSIMTRFFGLWSSAAASGHPWGPRGTNLPDSGSPYYDVYECADGLWLSVAPLEPQFFSLMLAKLGIDPAKIGEQSDQSNWPRIRQVLSARIREHPREHWRAVFEDSDACVVPVLTLGEVPEHPHLRARGTIVTIDGVAQPGPAPRFSRTRLEEPTPPRATDSDRADVLRDWGVQEERAGQYL